MIWGSFKRTQTKRKKEKRTDEVTERLGMWRLILLFSPLLCMFQILPNNKSGIYRTTERVCMCVGGGPTVKAGGQSLTSPPCQCCFPVGRVKSLVLQCVSTGVPPIPRAEEGCGFKR